MGDDGVERRAKIHKQDPYKSPGTTQVLQDVMQSHVDCIVL